MFGLCQDDIILAEANILAYPKVCKMGAEPVHKETLEREIPLLQ